MIKKSLAAVTFFAASAAMAANTPIESFTVPANITSGDTDLTVSLAMTPDAKIRETTNGQETQLTPCNQYAERASEQMRGVDNFVHLIKGSPAEIKASEEYQNLVNMVANIVQSEDAALEACQKSASPGPQADYESAKNLIKIQSERTNALKQAPKP